MSEHESDQESENEDVEIADVDENTGKRKKRKTFGEFRVILEVFRNKMKQMCSDLREMPEGSKEHQEVRQQVLNVAYQYARSRISYKAKKLAAIHALQREQALRERSQETQEFLAETPDSDDEQLRNDAPLTVFRKQLNQLIPGLMEEIAKIQGGAQNAQVVSQAEFDEYFAGQAYPAYKRPIAQRIREAGSDSDLLDSDEVENHFMDQYTSWDNGALNLEEEDSENEIIMNSNSGGGSQTTTVDTVSTGGSENHENHDNELKNDLDKKEDDTSANLRHANLRENVDTDIDENYDNNNNNNKITKVLESMTTQSKKQTAAMQLLAQGQELQLTAQQKKDQLEQAEPVKYQWDGQIANLFTFFEQVNKDQRIQGITNETVRYRRAIKAIPTQIQTRYLNEVGQDSWKVLEQWLWDTFHPRTTQKKILENLQRRRLRFQESPIQKYDQLRLDIKYANQILLVQNKKYPDYTKQQYILREFVIQLYRHIFVETNNKSHKTTGQNNNGLANRAIIRIIDKVEPKTLNDWNHMFTRIRPGYNGSDGLKLIKYSQRELPQSQYKTYGADFPIFGYPSNKPKKETPRRRKNEAGKQKSTSKKEKGGGGNTTTTPTKARERNNNKLRKRKLRQQRRKKRKRNPNQGKDESPKKRFKENDKSIRCHRCGYKGHYAPDCKSKKDKNGKKIVGENSRAFAPNKTRESDKNKKKSEFKTYQPTKKKKKESFVLDDMTRDVNSLHERIQSLKEAEKEAPQKQLLVHRNYDLESGTNSDNRRTAYWKQVEQMKRHQRAQDQTLNLDPRRTSQ